MRFIRQYNLFPYSRPLLRLYLRWSSELLYQIGMAVIQVRDTLAYVVRGRLNVQHWFEQTAFIGVDALGIALLLTLFSGMVLSLQVAQELSRQGASELVGGLVSMAILREMAPIMTAFAVISMVGSAYCAELATMKTQDQVDALKMLHVSPLRYLVLPRLMAGVTALPFMTVLTSLAGIVGGMVVSYYLANLNPHQFMESVWTVTKIKDVVAALLKSATFGFLIVLVSTTIGLNTRGGAREVGESTTEAVVLSFLAVMLADFLLTFTMFGGTG
ncbi:MAG: ABC transporter permease [Vampirovibrionales bacterium]|nr:ABC transporter permease [Cyanobacteria bacterium HKST-UBA03]